VAQAPRHTDAVADVLFGSLAPGESLYALLDAARNPEIPIRLKAAGIEYDSLYQGAAQEELWFVAPYLVRCERNSDLVSWLMESGWGQSWGIFVATTVDLVSLRQHFRRFVLVKVEGDEADFYFRFYDPRVLRVFLPTCSPEEAIEFFGPIRAYIMEERRSGSAAKFTASAEGVAREALALHAGADSSVRPRRHARANE
jgi:uncharacterized protein DUF4123